METTPENSNQSKGGEARRDKLSADERAEIARKAAAARWKLPKATHGGELNIGVWAMSCYNLEDGRRLISQRGFMDIVGMKGRKEIGHRLVGMLDASALKSERINKLVLDTQSPIKFLAPPNAVMAFGYEDRLVIDFCRALLDQRRLKALPEYALAYADAAEKFLASLAGVGIAALIDAATGYEKIRDRKELEALLDRYLRHEFSAWAKRFPDEFYQQIFRLKGWPMKSITKRPACVGTYTNDLVYARIEVGILKELQIRNPWIPEKKRREGYHHTLLTDDFGVPALSQHLHTIMVIMRGFSDGKWTHFKEFVDRTMPRKGDSVQELLSFYEEALMKGD